jgi:hypothetical protein
MTYACSGLFVILDGKWYFVTAGHVFKNSTDTGLEQLIGRKIIRIESAGILDYFGMDASAPHRPTMIDYDAALEKAIYLNEDDVGLDFAFLPLQDADVTKITDKGVKPFVEGNWQYEAKAEQYRITGFPEEEKIPSSCTDTQITSYIRPISVAMDRCDLPAGVDKPTYPYFAAKLLSPLPASAVGLSGSPIMAFNKAQSGGSIGDLVGIDVAWYEVSRIVKGSPMKYVVTEFRKLRDLRDRR